MLNKEQIEKYADVMIWGMVILTWTLKRLIPFR